MPESAETDPDLRYRRVILKLSGESLAGSGQRGISGEEVEGIARQIAAFPQLCLRADRQSAYAGWDADLAGALRAEAVTGEAPVRDGAAAGAARFAGGRGRSGDFGDI